MNIAKMSCECRISSKQNNPDQRDIHFCSLHAAAGEMREALQVCKSRIIALTGNIESSDMHPADEEAERLANEALSHAEGR